MKNCLLIFSLFNLSGLLIAQNNYEFIYPLSVVDKWVYYHYYEDHIGALYPIPATFGIHTWEIISEELSGDSIIWTINDIRNDTITTWYSPGYLDTTYSIDTTTFNIIISSDSISCFWPSEFELSGQPFFGYPVRDDYVIPRYYEEPVDTLLRPNSVYFNGIGFIQAYFWRPGGNWIRFEKMNLISVIINPINNVDNGNEVQNSLTSFSLNQNYPNPFNPTTTISFSIPQSQNVELKVFDLLGNEMATLLNEYKEAGEHKVELDGSDLTSGIYFYRLKAGEFVQTKKLVLAK